MVTPRASLNGARKRRRSPEGAAPSLGPLPRQEVEDLAALLRVDAGRVYAIRRRVGLFALGDVVGLVLGSSGAATAVDGDKVVSELRLLYPSCTATWSITRFALSNTVKRVRRSSTCLAWAGGVLEVAIAIALLPQGFELSKIMRAFNRVFVQDHGCRVAAEGVPKAEAHRSEEDCDDARLLEGLLPATLEPATVRQVQLLLFKTKTFSLRTCALVEKLLLHRGGGDGDERDRLRDALEATVLHRPDLFAIVRPNGARDPRVARVALVRGNASLSELLPEDCLREIVDTYRSGIPDGWTCIANTARLKRFVDVKHRVERLLALDPANPRTKGDLKFSRVLQRLVESRPDIWEVTRTYSNVFSRLHRRAEDEEA